MNSAKKLIFCDVFGEESPLSTLHESNQKLYITSYLQSLNVKKVIIEPNYFDRDYLSEFSAFYSLSSRGYPNTCQRVHFFDSEEADSELFIKALSEDDEAQKKLQDSYLGFTVMRPLPLSPFGRTVLKWFDDPDPSKPRITKPSRTYQCNIGGVQLDVLGLAWQQQDSGVAACATVSVWSMLHSSAFDDMHAVPTTTEITESAHKTASMGGLVYPSNYLTTAQLLEAIKEHGFAPVVSSGEFTRGYFSKQRFSAICSALLRSGYPVVIMGIHNDPNASIGHAVCGVGFRDPEQIDTIANSVSPFDASTDIIYIHDDNIGPNVRFKIDEKADHAGNNGAVLIHQAPDYVDQTNKPSINYPEFFPHTIVAAVHKDLRITPDNLYIKGRTLAEQICAVLNTALRNNSLEETGLLFTARFIKVSDYFNDELPIELGNNSKILARTRKALLEEVRPMCLHLGVIRMATPNEVLLDILYDTTDTDRNNSVYAHILYDQNIDTCLDAIKPEIRLSVLGTTVKAF